MTSAERGRRYREKNKNDPVFKAKEKERKAEAYKARKLARQEEKKEEEEKIDAKLEPEFTRKLKEFKELIMKFLTKQTELSIPEIQVIMENYINHAVPPQNFLNCDAMKRALFEARKKLNKDKNKTITWDSWDSAWKGFLDVYTKYVKKKTHNCGAKDFDWLHDADKIIKFIKGKKFKTNNGKQYAPSTRATKFQNLATVVSVLKGFEQTWKKLSEVGTTMRNKQMEDSMDNQFTPKELAKFVPWKNLSNAYTKTENKYFKAIMAVYTLMPPRRVEAMQRLTLRPTGNGWDEKPDTNYYFPKKKLIVLNKYKTFKKYKRWELKVPKNLATILDKWIKEYDIVPGNPIFPKDKGGYYAKGGFGGQIKKAFASVGYKDIGVNVLRHSKISDFYTKSGLSTRQKLDLANAMGHDVATQSLYNRLPPKNNKAYQQKKKDLLLDYEIN
tara:strand:+ start:49 stop:1377 length:1329 start_codon:yes stop_codon:yes gene_type:complete